ncbi:NAD-dependent epimerase/dehydratase family protein [Niveibacterium sp.]|uniref:NAD-dependent epimerase/dehydratase family protein n=1 Tax=Niveibacterium sp. TaxID=2017444 RepID=UPI0035B4E4FE
MSSPSRPIALVTGANGFVGSALVPHLKARGYRVRAALRQACPGAWDESVVIGDLNSPVDWRVAVSGVDAIWHLAARVHVMNETETDPLAAFRRVNVARTAELCNAAAAAGVRRLVYLSSIKVNGESSTPEHPFRPEDPPAPADPYAVSKLEAEAAVLTSRVDAVVLRPPLVYGPGVGANFARLLDVVRKGYWLPLGAIENRRDLVFVGNLADALCLLGEHPDAVGKVFLISDGEPLSTPALIRAVGDALGKRARLIPVPAKLLHGLLSLLGKEAEADRLLGSLEVDISTLTHGLGWRPRYSLATALAATVAGA